MEGEDLSIYDACGEQGQQQSHDDSDTLDQLEWELASETGRLTGARDVTWLKDISLQTNASFIWMLQTPK